MATEYAGLQNASVGNINRIGMTVMSNIVISKKDGIAICTIIAIVIGTLISVYYWYRNSGGGVGVLIFYKHGPVEYMKILQLT